MGIAPNITDWWVIKYDTSGNEIPGWNLTFDGGYSEKDAPATGVLDSSGNLYIGGFKGISAAPDYDWWIKKLDVNGNMLWEKSFAGENSSVDSVYSMSIYTRFAR